MYPLIVYVTTVLHKSLQQVRLIRVKSFYYVKYGSSIITSKISSKILSNENKKTGVSRKIVCFGILIHVFCLEDNSVYVFIAKTFDVIIDNPYLTL